MEGVNSESTSIFETSDGDHLRTTPGAVQVKVTLSIEHGFSSFTRKVADKNSTHKIIIAWCLNVIFLPALKLARKQARRNPKKIILLIFCFHAAYNFLPLIIIYYIISTQ